MNTMILVYEWWIEYHEWGGIEIKEFLNESDLAEYWNAHRKDQWGSNLIGIFEGKQRKDIENNLERIY